MGLAPWITCLWPGLPRLWWRGQGFGLFTAGFFAIWLNATLVESLVSPILANPWGRGANWAILALCWLVGLRKGMNRLSQFYHGDAHNNDELFARAQAEYLRGQWFEAESLLLRLVRETPADAEGRLLLATLYRHTRRPDLARAQLDRIERLPDGARWRWEVLQERKHAEKVASLLATEDDSPLAAAAEVAEPEALEEICSDGAEAAESGGLSKAA
jgi:hypothetical protein